MKPAEPKEAPPIAKGVEKNGLAVVVTPARLAFNTGEPIVLDVTFGNHTDQTMLLSPGPQMYDLWDVRLEGEPTGYQARCTTRFKARELATATIGPKQSLVLRVTFGDDYEFDPLNPDRNPGPSPHPRRDV